LIFFQLESSAYINEFKKGHMKCDPVTELSEYFDLTIWHNLSPVWIFTEYEYRANGNPMCCRLATTVDIEAEAKQYLDEDNLVEESPLDFC